MAKKSTLSNRTFGVEFEVYFTETKLKSFLKDQYTSIIKNNWIDQYTLQEIKEEANLAWKRKKNKVDKKAFIKNFLINEIYEYFIEYNPDICLDLIENVVCCKFGKKWEIHDDGSINGGSLTAEFVSPILQGEEGLKTIKSFIRFISKYASTNESCGLHVHVGAKDIIDSKNNLQMYTTALCYYSNFEKSFDNLVIKNRRKNNNYYTKSVQSIDETIRCLLNDNLYITDDRYYKLNLESLEKHGTFEFRQMHGVLNPIVVTNWIKICTSFIDTVKSSYENFNNNIVVKNKDVNQHIMDINKRIAARKKVISKLSQPFCSVFDNLIKQDLIQVKRNGKYFYLITPKQMNLINRHSTIQILREMFKNSNFAFYYFDKNQIVLRLVNEKEYDKQLVQKALKDITAKNGFIKGIPYRSYNAVLTGNKKIFKQKMAA